MIAYAAQSDLTIEDGDSRLLLQTSLGATPTGDIPHPTFFSGFVARPDVVASALLTVADVAATSYYDLSLLRVSLDPVLTASGDRLRIESFSRCNGVYARFDLLEDGIDSGAVLFGTTNVDINQPLRLALASVHATQLLHLAVGDDRLTVSTPAEAHTERQVDLPDRWVRGFAEVPMIASAFELVAELDRSQTMQFLASLPNSSPGPILNLTYTSRGLRTTATPAQSHVHLAGTARLATARRLMRFVHRTRIFRHASGASGWVFDVDGGRVTLVVSPEPYRGFSGEGGLLRELGASTNEHLDEILSRLAWQPVIDIDRLALDTGLRTEQVERTLAVLATSGRVGFDIIDSAWFHRELPLDPERQARDNPRLSRARELVARHAVTRDGDAWRVRSADTEHWVQGHSAQRHCTCQWQARYGNSRGPCAHVLAVEIMTAAHA